MGANAVKFQFFEANTMAFKDSKKNKLDFICSIFDINSLKIAKKVGMDAYKVASSDITDVILLKELSKEKRPIILSTGMASMHEIKKALKILKKRDVYLLH